MTTVPQPLQIISIGDSEESCLFRLNEENLAQIIDKIPPNTKVGIVAVVGAFRTGKSFLLNLFLRFLRNGKSDDESQAWLLSEGEELLEGNMNEGGWSIINSSKEEEAAPLQRQKSFAWRGGQQRQTTGIWMWSEPFIRATDSTNGEKIAILLMDTQGMFDNETTMTLTAQIFGLSTLVSSFQIYNVDKRIQEDNLQHLALFSEYGRMALLPQAEKTKPSLLKKTAVETALEKSQGDANEGEGKKESEDNTEIAAAVEEKKDSLDNVNSEETHDEEDTTKSAHLRKPFQRLQFLVRDWQNFDTEYSEGASQEVFDKVLEEMQTYLQGVLRPRNASDLQSTRDQILRCFEKLDCFLLPHPGFEVTKKNFDGSINRISPDFRALLNQYVRIIFNQELEAKHINQRAITGPELKNFFEVYVKMFQAGEKQFPKAMTMLEATAEANNRNAYDLAIKSYLDAMVALLGGKDNSDASTYVKETDFHQKHENFLQEARKQFDEIATMGSDDLIEQSRQKLLQQIEVERKRFHEVNALKNPYRDMEYYILPLLVAFVAYVSAKIVDRACSHDVCERIEDTFDNIYLFVFFMMIVMGWRQIRKIIMYVKELLPLVIGGQVVDIQSALHAAAASGGNKKTQ